MAFLGFDTRINLQKDQELLNFLILKIAVRLREHYSDRLQFALLQLDDFPHLRKHLKLAPNPRGLHFFIQEGQDFYLCTQPFVEEGDNLIDSKVLQDFTTDVVLKRAKPYQLSTEPASIFNEHGVRLFSARTFESYLYSRQYLEQETAVLFHADDEEADDVFAAFDELAEALRRKNVFKLVFAKINMNLNEVSKLYPVHQYPSVHLFFATEDGQFGAQQIVADSKRGLFHEIFTHSQVLAKEYDDKVYYEIMTPPGQEFKQPEKKLSEHEELRPQRRPNPRRQEHGVRIEEVPPSPIP